MQSKNNCEEIYYFNFEDIYVEDNIHQIYSIFSQLQYNMNNVSSTRDALL